MPGYPAVSEIYHNHIIHNPDGTGKRVSWDLLLLQICIVLPVIPDHRRSIAAVDPEKVNIRIIIDNFAAAIWGERDLFQLRIGSQEGGVLLQTVNEAERRRQRFANRSGKGPGTLHALPAGFRE